MPRGEVHFGARHEAGTTCFDYICHIVKLQATTDLTTDPDTLQRCRPADWPHRTPSRR